MGVVAQVHDLAVADGEDREQLPLELNAGELAAGRDCGRRARRGLRPRVARARLRPSAGQARRAARRAPAHVPRRRARRRRPPRRRRGGSARRSRRCRPRAARRSSRARLAGWPVPARGSLVSTFWQQKNTTGRNVKRRGRCALTAAEPLRARAQPEWRPAREGADLRGGGPRSTSGSLPSARHQHAWYAGAGSACRRRRAPRRRHERRPSMSLRFRVTRRS